MYSVSRRKCTHITSLESAHLLPGPLTYSCSNYFVQVSIFRIQGLEVSRIQAILAMVRGLYSSLHRAHFLSSLWFGFRVEVLSYPAENESLSPESEGETGF